MEQLEKDQTIQEVLERLERRFGPSSLSVVDHWDADLMSIGLHRHEAPRPLVYICTHKRPAGQYYADIELPSEDSEHPYKQGAKFESVDFEQLVTIISDALGLQQAFPHRGGAA